MEHKNSRILSDEDRTLAASLFLSGTSREAIYARFSNAEAELSSMFAELQSMKIGVNSPEEEVLTSVLSKVSPAVTGQEMTRYSERKVPFISELIKNMSKWKFGFSLAVLVVLIGGGYALTNSKHDGELAMKSQSGGSFAATRSADTGELSVADLDALTQVPSEEAPIINESDIDTTIATSDRDAMNAYTTTYSNSEI